VLPLLTSQSGMTSGIGWSCLQCYVSFSSRLIDLRIIGYLYSYYATSDDLHQKLSPNLFTAPVNHANLR
jgi:hypothetical protein